MIAGELLHSNYLIEYFLDFVSNIRETKIIHQRRHTKINTHHQQWIGQHSIVRTLEKHTYQLVY